MKGRYFATGKPYLIQLKRPVLILSRIYHDDVPVALAPYEVELENGAIIKGNLDELGKAEIRNLPARPVRVRYGAEPNEYAIVDDGTNPAYIAHFTRSNIKSLNDPNFAGGAAALYYSANYDREVVEWIWGTVQGGFNEKQSVSQIIADAIIGMIPLVGDVTAVRDIIAILMGMAKDPKKRESKLEWLGLVVLLFALIPVLGGAIKGVGKLLLKGAAKGGAATAKIRDFVAFLNRIGMGDAQKWFKSLNLESYIGELLGRWRELTRRLDMVLDSALNRFKGLLPKSMMDHLVQLKSWIQELAQKGEEMIPDAVKELNERLKAAQRQIYNGDWHDVPKNLVSKTREVEARLIVVPGGKKWVVDNMHYSPNGRESFFKRKGWPDLSDKSNRYYYSFDPITECENYRIISCFSGPMRAVKIPPRTKLFRIIPKNGDPKGSWWSYSLPKSGKEWREGYAVLDSWNNNKYYVEITVPEQGLLAWEGKVASQVENSPDAINSLGQYLPGGENQLFIDFTFEANAKALRSIASEMNKPVNKLLKPERTPWTDDYNGLHIPQKEVETEFLGPFETESKNRLKSTAIEKSTRLEKQEEESERR